MKTTILTCGMALMLFLSSCNKDDDSSNNSSTATINPDEVITDAQLDGIADDVTYIAETQSNEAPAAGRLNGTENFLSQCTAGISTAQNGDVWVRTIDFGTENCTLFNGNLVRGKIIISFTNDFDATTRTVSYAFENFYHNDRHVEGNRTVVKTIADGHPRATISLDMTVTTPNAGVYHRTGQRIRDFVEGYNTLQLNDNVFSITGSWITVLPSGASNAATIITPVVVKWNCGYIVSGTINIVRNDITAVLDYGNGGCDNQATMTIFGVTHNITLGQN